MKKLITIIAFVSMSLMGINLSIANTTSTIEEILSIDGTEYEVLEQISIAHQRCIVLYSLLASMISEKDDVTDLKGRYKRRAGILVDSYIMLNERALNTTPDIAAKTLTDNIDPMTDMYRNNMAEHKEKTGVFITDNTFIISDITNCNDLYYTVEPYFIEK